MNLARSGLKLFVANVLGSAIEFLGLVFFARELGPTPIGIFFLFQASMGILSIPADIGLQGALEKRISEKIEQPKFLSSAVLMKLFLILILTFIIIIFKRNINEYIGANVANLLAVSLILRQTAKISNSVLKGELRIGETALLKLIYQLTWVTTATILVMFGFSERGIIYGILLGYLIWALLGWMKVSVSFHKPTIGHIQSLFDYAKYNAISSLGGYFYSWLDVAIIGIFLSQYYVGAYETAWRLTAIVMLLSSSIGTTLFPQISQWDREEQTEKIATAIKKSIPVSMILVIPSFFGVVLFSEDILQYIFGEEFIVAGSALIILMFGKIIQSVHIILGHSLRGINRPDLAAYATIVSVLLNLVLNILLVFKFGIIGAAIATTVSFGINTALHEYYLSNFVPIEFPTREIAWCFLSAVGMMIILSAIKLLVSINDLLDLLLIITVGILSYSALVLSLGTFRRKLYSRIRYL